MAVHIVIDFKQDPVLGHGPAELDDAWHTFGKCTVLGAAVYLPPDWLMSRALNPLYFPIETRIYECKNPDFFRLRRDKHGS